MTQARTTAVAAHAAAREAAGAAREAARAAGHAAAVAHMADHELGAAAYAIRAVRAAADPDRRDEAGRAECRRQRAQLPTGIRDLVLDDQRLRNQKCWSLFDC
jgi:Imm-5 like putative immunity protein